MNLHIVLDSWLSTCIHIRLPWNSSKITNKGILKIPSHKEQENRKKKQWKCILEDELQMDKW